MGKKHFLAVLCALVIGLLAGCKPAPPPPPPPVPSGPQTKEEVMNLVLPALSPIQAVLAQPKGVGGLDEGSRIYMMNQLSDAVSKYGSQPFGREALREVGYRIADLGKQASAQERWRVALACVDAFDILQMESLTVARLEGKAKTMMEQPLIRVRGFLEDKEKNDLYVFLELVNRKTMEVKKVQMREGEETDSIRLLKVIGRNQKVRVEYTKIPGLIFDVDFEPKGM
mgnify:CR=1 FL=1